MLGRMAAADHHLPCPPADRDDVAVRDPVVAVGQGVDVLAEMAEAGASDATLMAIAGHMSRQMLEHYSHVRMAAKRTVLDKLESGLMGGLSVESQPAVGKAN